MKETGRFTGSNGISTIQYYIYHPQENTQVLEQPRAIVQISHGMCEFIERYEHFAEFLNEHGILVCGNDHAGHGASVNSMEDFGFFGEQDGWKHMVDDLRQLTVIVKKRYPGVPYFLLGHSMGSFLARVYLSWYAKELDGALIVGTSGPNPALPASFPITKAMIALKGKRYRSDMIRNIAFGTYNVKFKPKRTEHDWLSRDEKVVDTFEADPRCTFTFTLQGFLDLFSMLKFVSDKSWASMVPATLPVILLSGKMDPVGQYGKGVKEVHDRLAFAGVKDLKMQLYEGCRHEILNETNKETVYADVLDWIEKRIG
ncbi:MAG: lysophospholipase [Firmicutes bacterium]|nr:lysophospholipase [Bacillota bacterium]